MFQEMSVSKYPGKKIEGSDIASALLPTDQSTIPLTGDPSMPPSNTINGAALQTSGVTRTSASANRSGGPSPLRRSPAESTPEIATAISGKLNLETASLTDDEDDDQDSIMDDVSEEIYFDELPPLGLPISALPTGLCYDDRMRYHAEVATINEANYHPEDPRRIYYIHKELCQAGLVDDPYARKPLTRQPLRRIDAREATEEECCLIHTAAHYEFVQRTSGTYQS